MIGKALSWVLVASYATKITLKHYCTGLFEECLFFKQTNLWADEANDIFSMVQWVWNRILAYCSLIQLTLLIIFVHLDLLT